MSSGPRRGSISHKHWKLNWWDLWPLVDGERRPIKWTTNSLILSPHPSSPAIIARMFPSSSSFLFPSPNPVLNNPGAFSPPSIIEVSPGDEYVFAFFQGKGGDNGACIWHREDTIDTWKVVIFWPIKPGQGIVSAQWLGDERMWVPGSPPTRAPPLGPTNPFGRTTLLLITQSHIVQIVHRTSLSFPFQLVSAPLRHATHTAPTDRLNTGETTNGPGGLSVCVRAAIGLGYNESSIIIATSSTVIPPASASNPEISDHFGVPRPTTPLETTSPVMWENFGPELDINLFEVKITAHNWNIGVLTKPLSPLFPPVTSSLRLTDIIIVPQLVAESPTNSGEPSLNNDAQGAKSSQTLMHVILSYLDLEDYLLQKSDILCFELKRTDNASAESSKSVTWTHCHIQTRSITDAALSFLVPCRTPGSDSLLAGLLDLRGMVPRPPNGELKPKEVGIGKVIRLSLPHLNDGNDWEPRRLMAGGDDAGTNPPISATASPCDSFICTSPAKCSSTPKLGVHLQPQRKGPAASAYATLSESLLSRVLSDKPAADIVHILANPTYPLPSVVDTLAHTLHALDYDEFSVQDWHGHIAGIALEVYRTRFRRISNDTPAEVKERASLNECWHTAFDICSVRALKSAFEACKEDHGYDMNPVWHLIALSTWLVDFAERVVRGCVLWQGGLSVHIARSPNGQAHDTKVKMEPMEVERDDLFDGDLSPFPDVIMYNAMPSLIHISHPYALDNFIGALSHLNTFRTFLDTLTASRLKAGLAKEVVVDVIDCSGIDFKELESGLRMIKKLEEFTSLDADVFQRCFCSLSPTPQIHNLLVKACNLITTPNAVSKPQLFIKSSDLVDGISKLNLSTHKVNQERDVISKGALGIPSTTRTCARCNGKTETGQLPPPLGKETGNYGSWAVWEHEWERCICGGMWIKQMAPSY
ncbi:hypothetical protein K439DRAFT_1417327 [Ramaria rubella]|nr:hypothetical protein K439DRAFT_1417327 [Ramaria rubella]